jgi:hypothetical protein
MKEIKVAKKGAVKKAHARYKEITRRVPVSPELRETLLQRPEKPEAKPPANKRSATSNRDREIEG